VSARRWQDAAVTSGEVTSGHHRVDGSGADAAPEVPVGPRRGDFAAFWPITTRWADNDVYGHVNNVVYYAFVDTAVNGWLMQATGADIRELTAIGIVAETSCRFMAPLSFPDQVVVGVGLERLGRSSVVYRLGVFRNDETSPSALCRFVHVYVDRETRRPVSVPQAVRAAVQTLRQP
jgi:acyl-CoA thioester hydrolase